MKTFGECERTERSALVTYFGGDYTAIHLKKPRTTKRRLRFEPGSPTIQITSVSAETPFGERGWEGSMKRLPSTACPCMSNAILSSAFCLPPYLKFCGTLDVSDTLKT